MTYVMKTFLFLTSLVLSLLNAEAMSSKLPVTATELPTEVSRKLRDMISGHIIWDCDRCNEGYINGAYLVTFVENRYEYRLDFPYYPHGGYVVMFEMDIFGDARKEKIWQIVPPQDGRIQDEDLMCYIYDHNGAFCYAASPFCLNGKKVGDSLIGERRGHHWEYNSGVKYESYMWEQWKLSEESGAYVNWHLLQALSGVEDEIISQPNPPAKSENASLTETSFVFTPVGTHKIEETYHKDYDNTTVPKLQRENRIFCERFGTMTSQENQTLLGQENAMPMRNTYYVTSIYELVMTENAEWVKWDGEITEALAHWNETREEVMMASRGTTAEQALEKLQSSMAQNPQLPAYPLFDEE